MVKTVRKKNNSRVKKLKGEDAVDAKIMLEGERLESSLINQIKSYFHLHLDNYATPHGRLIEGTLFFLNFLAIMLFVIETQGITGVWKEVLLGAEFFLVGIFIIEYIARLWVSEKKIKHFFNIYSLIDLVAILPILASFANFYFLRIFRILRLFRMLRILRFQRIFKAKNTLFGNLSDTQLIIIRIVLGVFTIIFVSSGLIWTVENKINPGEFGTIFNAMYFAIVTLSTVGYGDVTPLSPLGKMITVFMILSGIALIPWQLGKLVKVVIMSATKIKVVCPKCSLEDHDPDAIRCKHCGAVIIHKMRRVRNGD